MSAKNNNMYYGLGAFALAFLGYKFYQNKQKQETVFLPEENLTQEPNPINYDLLLQKGSKGKEVVELQKMLNVNPDGVFGSITEAKLLALKGVAKITLKQFSSIPTINQNALNIGTKVMADVMPFTNLYDAVKKADGSYFSNYKIVDKVNFGGEIGKIIGINPAKNWYIVEEDNFLFPNKVYFVKANEVKKI